MDMGYGSDGGGKDGYGFGYEHGQGQAVLSLESHIPSLANAGGPYTHPQEQQDLFIGALLNARRSPVPTPLRLQFDGRYYRLPHPLSDEARLLIRSKRLNEHPSHQSAIIRAFGKADDWISAGAHPHHHGFSPSDYYGGIETESSIGFAYEGGRTTGNTEAKVLRSLLASTAHDRPCELCNEEATKSEHMHQHFRLNNMLTWMVDKLVALVWALGIVETLINGETGKLTRRGAEYMLSHDWTFLSRF